MTNHLKIDRFHSLAEDDRLLALQEIHDRCGLILNPVTFGILEFTLEHGTRRLSHNQLWHLIFQAWIPCATVECKCCCEPIPPEEMVLATENQGRCTRCQHGWEKFQAQ